MKIIKIKEDYYVVVDDSEIKVNDWYYLPRTNSAYECKEDPTELNLERGFGVAKITHSTQPFEKEKITNPTTQIVREAMEIASKDVRAPKVVRDGLVKPSVELLSLQEVKELIGEKSWKGYIDGTEWEIEIVDGKLKLI